VAFVSLQDAGKYEYRKFNAAARCAGLFPEIFFYVGWFSVRLPREVDKVSPNSTCGALLLAALFKWPTF
jgi:hypothetical protein